MYQGSHEFTGRHVEMLHNCAQLCKLALKLRRGLHKCARASIDKFTHTFTYTLPSTCDMCITSEVFTITHTFCLLFDSVYYTTATVSCSK